LAFNLTGGSAASLKLPAFADASAEQAFERWRPQASPENLSLRKRGTVSISQQNGLALHTISGYGGALTLELWRGGNNRSGSSVCRLGNPAYSAFRRLLQCGTTAITPLRGLADGAKDATGQKRLILRGKTLLRQKK